MHIRLEVTNDIISHFIGLIEAGTSVEVSKKIALDDLVLNGMEKGLVEKQMLTVAKQRGVKQ